MENVKTDYELSMKCSEPLAFKTESTKITMLSWSSPNIITKRKAPSCQPSSLPVVRGYAVRAHLSASSDIFLKCLLSANVQPSGKLRVGQ